MAGARLSCPVGKLFEIQEPPVQRFGAWILVVVVLLVSSTGAAAEDTNAPFPSGPWKIASEHLPNAYRLHERVISGGLPEGAAAFRELQVLGVKTVISVDGARPDVTTAARYGMRYVHVPHGYDGIPPERITELAKAVRDLPGPVYIHCHHGKHRSPAAATAACIAVGYINPDSAENILTTAGTSKKYRGLYESALSAQRLDDPTLDALMADFPETAELPEMAQTMVQIEHAHSHLKQFAANQWRAIKNQPDLDPSHEALLLREHFTELLRTSDVQEQPVEFQTLVRSSEQAARSLETQLRAARPLDAAEAFQQITRQCTACHHDYRDVPLSEKRQPKSK